MIWLTWLSVLLAPLASFWQPFGFHLAPTASLWFPFASIWLTLNSLWDPFCSLAFPSGIPLAPIWLLFGSLWLPMAFLFLPFAARHVIVIHFRIMYLDFGFATFMLIARGWARVFGLTALLGLAWTASLFFVVLRSIYRYSRDQVHWF